MNDKTQAVINSLCGDPRCFDEEVVKAKASNDPVGFMAYYLEQLWKDEGHDTDDVDWAAVATKVMEITDTSEVTKKEET